jgi:flagellar motor switch protein FliN/FliY
VSSASEPIAGRNPADVALAAAEAAAAVLPAAEVLTASGAQPGSEQVAALFASGVVADLAGGATGPLALLVAEDLVQAIADSPIEGLELAGAVQPALDAAAQALGGSAQVGRVLAPADVTALFSDGFTVVPLTGSTIAGALLVSDATLSGRPVPATPSFEAAPGATGGVADVPPPSTPSTTHGVVTPIAAGAPRGIEMLHGVDMEVTVELGRARMTVRDLLALTPGNVLELDRAAGSPADLLVNGRLIARGEVVVVDEDFGLRVTEILGESVAG